MKIELFQDYVERCPDQLFEDVHLLSPAETLEECHQRISDYRENGQLEKAGDQTENVDDIFQENVKQCPATIFENLNLNKPSQILVECHIRTARWIAMEDLEQAADLGVHRDELIQEKQRQGRDIRQIKISSGKAPYVETFKREVHKIRTEQLGLSGFEGRIVDIAQYRGIEDELFPTDETDEK